MSMKQIMMVGAGSVGGFFGAHLAKHNPNVSFLLRPKTLAAVRQQGLDDPQRHQAPSRCIRRRPRTPRSSAPDLIILGVKAYDLDEVMAQIEPVLTDRTVILTLQNGIDTEDRIIARIKRDCVVGGVAFIYSKIVEPGVIDHYKKGAVAIGELMGHESERVLQIRELFTTRRHSLPALQRHPPEQMGKDVLELRLQPDDGVDRRQGVAKALDHPEMMGVIRQIVGEVAAVSAAVKVPLPSGHARPGGEVDTGDPGHPYLHV